MGIATVIRQQTLQRGGDTLLQSGKPSVFIATFDSEASGADTIVGAAAAHTIARCGKALATRNVGTNGRLLIQTISIQVNGTSVSNTNTPTGTLTVNRSASDIMGAVLGSVAFSALTANTRTQFRDLGVMLEQGDTLTFDTSATVASAAGNVIQITVEYIRLSRGARLQAG